MAGKCKVDSIDKRVGAGVCEDGTLRVRAGNKRALESLAGAVQKLPCPEPRTGHDVVYEKGVGRRGAVAERIQLRRHTLSIKPIQAGVLEGGDLKDLGTFSGTRFLVCKLLSAVYFSAASGILRLASQLAQKLVEPRRPRYVSRLEDFCLCRTAQPSPARS